MLTRLRTLALIATVLSSQSMAAAELEPKPADLTAPASEAASQPKSSEPQPAPQPAAPSAPAESGPAPAGETKTGSAAIVTPVPESGASSQARPQPAAAQSEVGSQRAIQEFTEAIEKKHDDAGAYVNRGTAYNKLEQYEQAIKDFDEAIRLDPKIALAYAGRGYAYCNLGKYQLALKDCNEAIRLDPKLAAAYTVRSQVYAKLEQYQKSVEDSNKALSLESGSGSSELSHSAALYMAGNYQAALQAATRAIQKNPNDPAAYDNRGLAETQLKQYQAAIKDFNKALSLKPHEPRYICHRGIVYAEMGNNDQAIKDFDEAIRLKPNYALAYYDRGISHYLRHEYEQAMKDVQDAIRFDPHYALALYELPLDPTKGKPIKPITNPEEYYYRATTRILMIKNQTAQEDLRKYLDKTSWRGRLALSAVILSYLGHKLNHQIAQAEAVLSEAKKRCDTSQWPYPVISYLSHEMTAEDLLGQATDNDRLTDAHGFIGIDLMLAGHRDQAISHLMWAKHQGNGKLVSYSLAVREIEKIQFAKHRETERT